MTTQVVDAVSVDNDLAIIGKSTDHLREKFLHIHIPPQPRTDNPTMNCLLPRLQLLTPLLQHHLLLSRTALRLLFRHEQRVHDDLWRVRFDSCRTKLRTENVTQVRTHTQRRYRRVVRRTRELERTTNDRHPTILPLRRLRTQLGEHRYYPPHQRGICSSQNHVSIAFNRKIIHAQQPRQQQQPMADPFDYRTAYLHLRTDNELLRAQLEDASERESTLKRQIEIMAQLQTNSSPTLHSIDTTRIKEQLSNALTEKEHLETTNRSLHEKIEDLKYHNGELRSLNEKMANLHSREIEMLRREANGGQRIRELEDKERVLIKQRETLSKKLQEVAKVAEEMEHYYVAEVQRRNEQIKNKDEQLRSRQEEVARLNRDLEGTRTHRLQQNDLVRQNNLKWEQHLTTIQEQHDAEVSELRGKVKFLIDKIQDEGVCKPQLTSLSTDLVQSKMVQSNSSMDSFRIGPSNSLGPARRNTSGAKTPSKYGKSRMSGALVERNL